MENWFQLATEMVGGVMTNLPGTHSRLAVAYLDILGFKNMIKNGPLIDVAMKYDAYISTATGMNQSLCGGSSEPQLFPRHPLGTPYCTRYVISDSIILIADGDDALSCLKLLVHTWRLVQASLAHRMSVRGAIASGEMYFDLTKGIYLGHGLTAAYELEQRQNWVGVAIDKSVELAYPEIFPPASGQSSILESLFLKYPIPVKGGGVLEARTLNWRWNMVVEDGTRSLFLPCDEKPGQEKIDNALEYARTVVETGRIYAEDHGACPAELRAMFIGKSEPPFPHGDDL
ncbi:MAG: hypothetical protein AB7V45_17365 [Candidatus Krumholzibacteriia bacterium]